MGNDTQGLEVQIQDPEVQTQFPGAQTLTFCDRGEVTRRVQHS